MKSDVQGGSGNLKRWGWLKEVGYVTVEEGVGELEVGHAYLSCSMPLSLLLHLQKIDK